MLIPTTWSLAAAKGAKLGLTRHNSGTLITRLFSYFPGVVWLKFAFVIGALTIAPDIHGWFQPSGERPFAEFQRISHCGVGWQLAIYSSGAAHQQVENTCVDASSYSRLYKLSREDVETVRRAIAGAQFDDLPDEIYPTVNDGGESITVVPDEDAFVITVWTEEKKKRVLAFGLERSKVPEAQRFLSVWRSITGVIPDPSEADKRR